MKMMRSKSLLIVFVLLLCYMFLLDYKDIKALPPAQCKDCYGTGSSMRCYYSYYCGYSWCNIYTHGFEYTCQHPDGWDCTTPGYCN